MKMTRPILDSLLLLKYNINNPVTRKNIITLTAVLASLDCLVTVSIFSLSIEFSVSGGVHILDFFSEAERLNRTLHVS